jgi:hypothetical protein
MLIKCTIEGTTPLIMNRFNEESLETGGRDKNALPREIAEKTAYLDDKGKLYYPTINLYSAIIAAGKFHQLKKNKVTTQKSSLIPAGILMNTEVIYFEKPKDNKFEVDSRPVVIPSTGGKIMRHRARLDAWQLSFHLDVDENMFSTKQVKEFVTDAGKKIGIGDFRPERKGFYGRFTIKHWAPEK